MEKADLLVPKDGFIKGNWKISRLKEKVFFTIKT